MNRTIVRNVEYLLQFGWPFLLFEAFNWAFDKVFFTYALWKWGPVVGAIIPSLIALLLNMLIFWLYDAMRIDWLKAHALRALADKENATQFQKLLAWHHSPKTTLRDRIVGELRFMLLLIPFDPVIIAIYYRTRHFQGVNFRDWIVLAKATFVACVVWLLILEPLVFFIKLILSSF